MEANFSFSSTEWTEVTFAPKDLISRILVVDCRQRPTVDQCLNHEFFRYRKDSIPSEEMIKRVFKPKIHFRRVILCVRELSNIFSLKYFKVYLQIKWTMKPTFEYSNPYIFAIWCHRQILNYEIYQVQSP